MFQRNGQRKVNTKSPVTRTRVPVIAQAETRAKGEANVPHRSITMPDELSNVCNL